MNLPCIRRRTISDAAAIATYAPVTARSVVNGAPSASGRIAAHAIVTRGHRQAQDEQVAHPVAERGVPSER